MQNYLKALIYTYRAYANVAVEKYEVGIEDMDRARKLKKLDPASDYNRYVALGILEMDKNEF